MKSEAAAAQHKMLGIEAERGNYKRNDHTNAQWFGTAGLGLFIHWGISSVHGKGDLSWSMIANTPWDGGVKNRNKVTPNEYFDTAKRFNPDKYDPDVWLAAAAKAGFRYAVLTTRHHDGYSLWPSEVSQFDTRTHMGGRDLVKPFVDACRKNGLKVGLYYSPPDWYWNRNYMSFNWDSGNKAKYPGRPDYGLDHTPVTLPPKPEDWDNRYHAYVRAQVIELLTRYAPVDLLWFDGGDTPVMSIAEIRTYNPGIVVNPRMHGYGDFKTPECAMPKAPIEGWWELCEIWTGAGWGYENPGSEHYKPLSWMLGRLQQVRRWNGNYLINVSPRPDGSLPEAYYKRMDELAALGRFDKLDKQWRSDVDEKAGESLEKQKKKSK